MDGLWFIEWNVGFNGINTRLVSKGSCKLLFTEESASKGSLLHINLSLISPSLSVTSPFTWDFKIWLLANGLEGLIYSWRVCIFFETSEGLLINGVVSTNCEYKKPFELCEFEQVLLEYKSENWFDNTSGGGLGMDLGFGGISDGFWARE